MRQAVDGQPALVEQGGRGADVVRPRGRRPRRRGVAGEPRGEAARRHRREHRRRQGREAAKQRRVASLQEGPGTRVKGGLRGRLGRADSPSSGRSVLDPKIPPPTASARDDSEMSPG